MKFIHTSLEDGIKVSLEVKPEATFTEVLEKFIKFSTAIGYSPATIEVVIANKVITKEYTGGEDGRD